MCDACAKLYAVGDVGWAVHWLARIDSGHAAGVPPATLRALRTRGFVEGRTVTAVGRTLLDAHAPSGDVRPQRTIAQAEAAQRWPTPDGALPRGVRLNVEQKAMADALDRRWRTVEELSPDGIRAARRRPLLVGLQRLGVAERGAVRGQPEMWRKADR